MMLALVGSMFLRMICSPATLPFSVQLLHPLPSFLGVLITSERCLFDLVVTTADVLSFSSSLLFSLLCLELSNVHDLKNLDHRALLGRRPGRFRHDKIRRLGSFARPFWLDSTSRRSAPFGRRTDSTFAFHRETDRSTGLILCKVSDMITRNARSTPTMPARSYPRPAEAELGYRRDFRRPPSDAGTLQ